MNGPTNTSGSRPSQHNSQRIQARGRSTVNAHQGSGPMNIFQTLNPSRRGYGPWLLLVLVIVDVGYFFFGMLSYSGTDNSGDMWRAWIFLFLVVWTLRTAVKLARRRF